MVIKKTLCDRCGAEILNDEHPPRLVQQTYVKSEKVCVQSAYKTEGKIHFCEDCQKAFKEFMSYER